MTVKLLIAGSLIWLAACAPSVRYRAEKQDISAPQQHASLEQFIRKWMGTPYLFGGMDRGGVDCSGFTAMLYRSVYNIDLPRQAEDQYAAGTRVRDNAMREGDLVFFRNVRRSGIDHVGVYIGDGRFVHASTSSGVVISDLDEAYYRKRFAGARRYF
jgi:lipoprotein Spr